ncbi:MAG: DUF4411 family protein [Acidobacteriota bacterium]
MAAIYCIDTSALLQAYADYPQDAFPGLWEQLDALIGEGRLVSSIEVFEELKRHEGDAMHTWAKARKAVFLELSEDIQRVVQSLMVAHPELAKHRLNAHRADPFVIATAKVRGATVVTNEQRDGSSRRPKIPLVCDGLGISCVRFSAVIRVEGWVFRC